MVVVIIDLVETIDAVVEAAAVAAVVVVAGAGILIAVVL